MKKIVINDKEYTLKYSIEASLYEDCVSNLLGMLSIGDDVNSQNLDAMITKVAHLPAMAMKLFYAGLIECHGTSGDSSVLNEGDAIALAKTYLTEHEMSFEDLIGELIGCMQDDGFFKLTGLDEMLTGEEKPKRTRRRKNSSGVAEQKVVPIEKS